MTAITTDSTAAVSREQFKHLWCLCSMLYRLQVKLSETVSVRTMRSLSEREKADTEHMLTAISILFHVTSSPKGFNLLLILTRLFPLLANTKLSAPDEQFNYLCIC